MNKKAQIPPHLINGFLILLFIVFVVIPVLNSINLSFCKDEKGTIDNLNRQLEECNLKLGLENKNIEHCRNELFVCEENLSKCKEDYDKLSNECSQEETQQNIYYFIKIFSDRTILFDTFIIYHVYTIILSISLSIIFTLKLFNIEVNIDFAHGHNNRWIKKIKFWILKYYWLVVIIILLLILIPNIT